MLLFILGSMLMIFSACGQSPAGSGSSSQDQQPKTTLPVKEFESAIKNGDAVLIDVRTPQEFASGHIPGSINIDWTAQGYEASFASLDPKRPLLLYCAAGGRSDQARAYLQDKGYEVRDLEEGIAAWKEAGLPIER